jgi:uncharacterized OB-fold protein
MSNPSQVWRHHKKLHNYLNKKGKLLVWTKLSVPPSGFEDSIPYFSGIVQFETGEKLPVQIVDCNETDLKPNLKVISVIRRGAKVKPDEVIEYVVKVKPFDSAQGRPAPATK